MPDAPHPAEKPVTTRDVAARAGVSSATVSLALRDNPRIAPKTRELVKRVAAELGYRPDPQLAKLMHRLQAQRLPGFQSTIAALTTIPEERELDYAHDISSSAKARAEALGYAFTVMRLPDQDTQKTSVQRILLSRGVEGLLLLPLDTARAIDDWLDWSRFSVVAATYGVLAPDFHRVVPHQFGNTLLLCEKLAKLGYRRIGLVIPAHHDLTVHHGFSAAVAWQNLFGGTEMVRPLVHTGAIPADLERWFKRERPDVIIAPGEADCRTIARRLKLALHGPVGFAITDRYKDSEFAGIDERPFEIGAAAVDLLHTKILSGNAGVPKVPTVAMITGEWIPGPSVGRNAAPAAT